MLQKLSTGRKLVWRKKLPSVCARTAEHNLDGAQESRAGHPGDALVSSRGKSQSDGACNASTAVGPEAEVSVLVFLWCIDKSEIEWLKGES